MSTTYRAPMIAIQLSENEVSDLVQLFRTGTFYHSEYGQFQIKPEDLKTMEHNFKNKVRGIDIAIDYKHDSEDIAAGWIQSLELSNDGTELWAKVDWTPQGKKVLSEKEFRYLSPDFTFNYQDNESLKKFGPVLLGAGLTNRPTIKNMEPVVELSEVPSERDQLIQKREERSKKYGIEITKDSALTPPSGQPTDESFYGDPVNYKYPMPDRAQAANARVRFKQFANSTYSQKSSQSKIHDRIVKRELELGVQPDYDPKDSLDALLSGELKSKLMKKKGIQAMDLNKLDPAMLDQMAPDEMKALCMQLIAALKKGQAPEQEMADMKKKLGDAEAKYMEADKQCSELKKSIELAEKKSAFSKLLSEGKVCPAQEQAYLEGNIQKFTELSGKMNLGEVGSSQIPASPVSIDSKEKAEDEVMKLAELKLSEKKVQSLEEGIRLVLKEKQELKNKIYS